MGPAPPTKGQRESIYKLMRQSAPRRWAALGSGVDPKVMHYWMCEGARAGAVEPYKSFTKTIYSIEAKDIAEGMMRLRELAVDDARAADSYFKLRYPAGFGSEPVDPIDAPQTKKGSMRHAFAAPGQEMRELMDSAGVVVLTDAQRAVLEQAGLLKPRPQLPEGKPDE